MITSRVGLADYSTYIPATAVHAPGESDNVRLDHKGCNASLGNRGRQAAV